MSNQTAGPNFPALIDKMAHSLDVDADALDSVLRQQVLKNASPTEVAAFLIVATQYGLNPITKEIYAFPDKRGGLTPIVGVDGWIKLANNQPAFDGIEFVDRHDDKGGIVAITARVYRKDRSRPTETTEYLEECKRPTEPWTKWPSRMLRHKAMIQALRIAFGFSGIAELDDVEREFDGPTIEGRATARATFAQVVAETSDAAQVEAARVVESAASAHPATTPAKVVEGRAAKATPKPRASAKVEQPAAAPAPAPAPKAEPAAPAPLPHLDTAANWGPSDSAPPAAREFEMRIPPKSEAPLAAPAEGEDADPRELYREEIHAASQVEMRVLLTRLSTAAPQRRYNTEYLMQVCRRLGAKKFGELPRSKVGELTVLVEQGVAEAVYPPTDDVRARLES
jgi:phage recombination protein Bet